MNSDSDQTRAEFVGEAIMPDITTFDTAAMSRGEPGLPARFAWRGADYAVSAVIETWKTTGPCTSGGSEKYVRRHWFRIRTTSGETMTLYCTRQAARGSTPTKSRWTLYTIQRVPRPPRDPAWL